MNNKFLVELVIPSLEMRYDVYVPVNKKVGNIIILLSKVVADFSMGYFEENDSNKLYDGDTGEQYPIDVLVRDTNIRNGSRLILM